MSNGILILNIYCYLQATSTCLHHSQLEVSTESYVSKLKMPHEESTTKTLFHHEDGEPASCRDIDKIVKKISTNDCQRYKNIEYRSKKVSIPTLYKPTHNKSETGHKHKSCPLHKKNVNKIKEREGLTPFISDHMIKTYY